MLIPYSVTFVVLFTSTIRANFLTKTHQERLVKKELYNSKEGSVSQCAQRCTFLSKDAIMEFDELKMTCLCFSSVNDKSKLKANNATETKSFMFQKRKITQFKNHALKKPSKQSSTAPDYTTLNDAEYANDGNTSTNSATNDQFKDEWWELDMEKVVKIGLIKLTLNQWALGKGYYKNLTILSRVKKTDSWRKCELVANPTHFILETSCQQQISARFVKIMVSLHNPLYLVEVEVYDQEILEIRKL